MISVFLGTSVRDSELQAAILLVLLSCDTRVEVDVTFELECPGIYHSLVDLAGGFTSGVLGITIL